MSTTNYSIFSGLKIVVWVIFIGLCIDAGGLFLNFVFSLVNPENVHRLYHDMDLSELYDRSRMAFYSMYSFIIIIAGLKAHLFHIVVQLMSKIDLAKPFNRFVSKQITQISYYTLSVGLLSFLARQTGRNLSHRNYDLDMIEPYWAESQAFIIMAAVIYIISIIFSKGVEYQEELEETV